MKKKLLLLAFVAFGCGPDFDMDTRLVYDIRVVDSQGAPIPGAYLEFSVDDYDDGYFGGSLANGLTGADGHIRGLFPPPSSQNEIIQLSVNGSNPFSQNPTPTPFEYYALIGLKRSDFVDYRVPVTQVILYRTEELTDLELLLPQGPQFVIDEFSTTGEFSNRVYTASLQHNYLTSHLRVRKNQAVTLHYSVRNTDNNASVEYDETVEIGDEPVTHPLGS